MPRESRESGSITTRPAARERLRAIGGAHNALLKELRRAFARGECTAQGFCAIEGLRMVEEAIRSGLRFRALFFSASGAGKAERLLPQIGKQAETILLPDRLFAGAVPSETPQGVAALVAWKEASLDAVLAKAASGPLLVLAGIQDPGNLGTILRSAEAFGVGGIVLGEGTVTPLNAKAVRASAGSVFRVPLARAHLDGAVAAMRKQGIRLIATSSHKGTPLAAADFRDPQAIFIGNEGAGLPRSLTGEIDEFIAIPHSPRVESLNAGVAASIVLYEMAKQRSHRTA